MNANSSLDEEKLAKLRCLLQQKLMESGEKDRLTELLRTRLLESGWKDELVALCKEYVKCRGVESISVDDIVNDVTPKARQLVPDEIKRELLQRIKQFLVSQSNNRSPLVEGDSYAN